MSYFKDKYSLKFINVSTYGAIDGGGNDKNNDDDDGDTFQVLARNERILWRLPGAGVCGSLGQLRHLRSGDSPADQHPRRQS